ncbi:unnamed protein product [Rangifer tarandus platyrhynchus]|uniref:Basic proline-rich protein-like n=2 Tax=Rangifer tarandus platyrhynchus TaxID=3082113 RepID=A0ABN8ZXG9_RANTA|nr:unnamed protein product [Rangifer tarandus platyrhynchus]CAI9712419.1 unnamed protein product [Rangifer tarandus platyrhynchus]
MYSLHLPSTPPPKCTDPRPPPSGPTGERTHNKRPGPATPSGRRLGPRSAASSDNDQHLARPLSPGSPLTTRRPGALAPRSPDSPFPARRWHQTKEAGARGPGAARTQRPRPGQDRAAPFEERRAGRRRPRGRPLALRARASLAPRGCGRSGSTRPPAGPLAGPPHCSLPREKANHAPVRGETPPGVFVAALGPPRALSSPGWARPGRGAAGPGLGGGGRSAGVWAAAARAGMRLGRSSLKCGASHSLTPASLQRRAAAAAAAAAAGALPFLVAGSLARPAPPAPPPRARPAPPPLQAGRTHHGCAPGPRLPRPSLPRRPLCVWLDKPPDLPGPREWLSGDRGRSVVDLGAGRENVDRV